MALENSGMLCSQAPVEILEACASEAEPTKFLLELAQGNYIQAKENVVFLGPTGTGKTHLAVSLGLGCLPPGPPGPLCHRCRPDQPAHRGPGPTPAK